MPLTCDRTSPTVATLRRRFAAPPAVIHSAHTDPLCISRWLTGPEGWIMSRCDIDAQPGGAFRYDWQSRDGARAFHLTGEFQIVDAPHHLRHVERLFMPDAKPDTLVDTRFHASDGGTQLVMVIKVADPATLDAMLGSGMTAGMEASYSRLDTLVPAA